MFIKIMFIVAVGIILLILAYILVLLDTEE